MHMQVRQVMETEWGAEWEEWQGDAGGAGGAGEAGGAAAGGHPPARPAGCQRHPAHPCCSP